MSQYISLNDAIIMASRYRQERENILAEPFKNQDILPLSETMDREVIQTLIDKSGCAHLRIYYGMDEELKVHAIFVPVDSNNADILPVAINYSTTGGKDAGEYAVRCPPICPPGSPLNSP